ncbi:membrane-associated protein, putative [Bodo saltans]|uniref:Membrane-associated protein, putative n=1 Tax=Bodo saltans TaxID=75058 RepID=A0A0S4IVG3_BODSA|nr:membrane-associated protein, putative [Bodo saltans]|eukprot:CUG03673.1 membrane-associated protein, putative [Bodo saltans]
MGPRHTIVLRLLVLLLGTAEATFNQNLVLGSNPSVNGPPVFYYWEKSSSACRTDSYYFRIDATTGDDKECNFTQRIDVTFARNYLLHPGGRVVITMQGDIEGGNPDYSSLTLRQQECGSTSVKFTIGGDPIYNTATTVYTWTTRLMPNVCSLTVDLYLRNYEPNGAAPSAEWITCSLSKSDATLTQPLTMTEAHVLLSRSMTGQMYSQSSTKTPSLFHTPSSSPQSTATMSSTLTAVTSTGVQTETQDLSVTRSNVLSMSLNRSRSAIFGSVTSSNWVSSTAAATLSTATAHATSTRSKIPPSITASLALPHTATPTVPETLSHSQQPKQPLANAAVTVVADVVLTSVATVVMMGAASGVAGTATLQAILSSSECGPIGADAADTDERRRSGGSSLATYLVSPFMGNSFTMIGGNLGLVVIFFALHLAVLLVARTTATGRRNPRAAATMARFPQFTLVAANLAMQGVLLGGWQLLWRVLRSEEEEGTSALCVLCFVISMTIPLLVCYAQWKLRVTLIAWASCSRFWRDSVANHTRVHPKRVPYDGQLLLVLVGNSRWLLSFLKFAGPTHIWTPYQHRVMFGVTINAARPRSALVVYWPFLELYVVPVIITASAAFRPPLESREAACAVTMTFTALLLIVVAAAVMIRRPFRVKFKNIHYPLSLCWIALTAVFRQPALIFALGSDSTAAVLASLSFLQSLTLVVVIVVSGLLFVFIDRHNNELVNDAAEAEDERGTDDSDDDPTEDVNDASTKATRKSAVNELELSLAQLMDHDYDDGDDAIHMKEFTAKESASDSLWACETSLLAASKNAVNGNFIPLNNASNAHADAATLNHQNNNRVFTTTAAAGITVVSMAGRELLDIEDDLSRGYRHQRRTVEEIWCRSPTTSPTVFVGDTHHQSCRPQFNSPREDSFLNQ